VFIAATSVSHRGGTSSWTWSFPSNRLEERGQLCPREPLGRNSRTRLSALLDGAGVGAELGMELQPLAAVGPETKLAQVAVSRPE
jgi:hypothetical protein